MKHRTLPRATLSRATLSGCAAILLWGALATFSALTGAMPPFLVTAVTFAIAAALGLGLAVARGQVKQLRPTPASFALGLYGFFVFHALYFAAVKLAPPAEAQLVASLWALLIVLMAALLPGQRLQARHLLGGVIGLAAAALLVWPRLGAGGGSLLGYGLAFGCALVWSSYSVASRLVAAVPTASLATTCAATALLATLCHLVFEVAVWPQGAVGWLALLALGLGPVGAAFFLWDVGMKAGDVSLLGVLSYAAPVISTAMLVLAGLAEPSWRLGVAAGLMVLAGVVATYERPSRTSVS
jgi:drug/metabolite transporter (DMT)-like permease